MNYKVAFISLGCAKNLVNTEQMMARVQDAGHTLMSSPEGADVAVVNTCGFIDSAKEEAIGQILELGQRKAAGAVRKILVTGCLVQRYKEEILKELPEVDGVLGTGSYAEIVRAVEEVMSSTARFQLPGGPKYSGLAPGTIDFPCPMWSFPTTAKPRSVR